MTSSDGRIRPPAPPTSGSSRGRLAAAALGLAAVLIALFGDPVPSAAAAVIVVVLAELVQHGRIRYAQLARVITHVSDAIHGRQ